MSWDLTSIAFQKELISVEYYSCISNLLDIFVNYYWTANSFQWYVFWKPRYLRKFCEKLVQETRGWCRKLTALSIGLFFWSSFVGYDCAPGSFQWISYSSLKVFIFITTYCALEIAYDWKMYILVQYPHINLVGELWEHAWMNYDHFSRIPCENIYGLLE